MRSIIRTAGGSLLLAGICLGVSGAASAAPPFSSTALIAPHDNATRVDVGHRRYRSFKDDDARYYDNGPSEPARVYRVPALPPPVVEYRRPLPYPPVTVYEPPVYGWNVPPWGAPSSPASCGKFRRWDGSGCGEARLYPRQVGPRW